MTQDAGIGCDGANKMFAFITRDARVRAANLKYATKVCLTNEFHMQKPPILVVDGEQR